MPQIALVDPAHRQQYVQVGDPEVRVVGGLPADPGAEADVAAQERGSSVRSAGRATPSADQGSSGRTRNSSGARCFVRTRSQVPAASVPPSESGMEQQPASQSWPRSTM